DEPVGQGEGRHGVRVDRPEQAQGVVLLRRQVEAGEQGVLVGAQAVVGPPEVEECLLLGRVEARGGSALGAGGHHYDIISRPDNSCPDDYSPLSGPSEPEAPARGSASPRWRFGLRAAETDEGIIRTEVPQSGPGAT